MGMADRLKQYETIGCCGIDCGLCPRFHSKGGPACPGCGGLNFKEMHPSCGFLSCCALKKGFEVCSFCDEYPCKRFDAEKDGFDSFVTHKRILPNLAKIRKDGIEVFDIGQRKRISILKDLLERFDDGRSKSLYCIASALLPAEALVDLHKYACSLSEEIEVKEKNKLIKNKLSEVAGELLIDLRLNRKG